MITPEEAVTLTANVNNDITKKVDEIINVDLDAYIRSEAAAGHNYVKYYFKTRGENVDPIVETFYSTIARLIRSRLQEMGWNVELICNARNSFDIVGIAIYW